MRRLLPLLLLPSAFCQEAPLARLVEVTARPGMQLDLTALRWEPMDAAQASLKSPSRVELAVDGRSTRLVLEHPEACSVELSLTADPSLRIDVVLTPWIDLGPDLEQAGFDVPFRLEVRRGCEEAGRGSITWRQVSGASLAELAAEHGGFVLTGRTRKLAELRPEPVPFGVVPFSPRTRGQTNLEAIWRGPGHPEVRRRWSVAAAARSGGLPAIALGNTVVLGGEGWTARERPRGAASTVTSSGAVATLTPDVPGRWVLAAADGRSLELHVNRIDRTLLDCGRTECHPAPTRWAATSSMTSALMRALEGRTPVAPLCALRCHAAGEPGASDGGFGDLARTLGVSVADPGHSGAWEELPRLLRRTGGVGCLACHGAGTIPESSARWAILRADVCAVCHDAPPQYVLVEAWRTTRMARADALPEARGPGCARCHSTAGFLASLGVEPARPSELPLGAPPVGIACAACHAPHGPNLGRRRIRQVPELPLFGALQKELGTSAICLPCHAPSSMERVDSSAAALLLGVGGVRVEDGAPLASPPPPHGTLRGGCLLCHAGTDAAGRGAGHSFAVRSTVCVDCHGGEPKGEVLGERAAIAVRAQHAWARLGGARLLSPLGSRARWPHASAPTAAGADARLRRAMFDLLLVLEDPAAVAHNAAYARALLDEVERFLR